VSGAAAAAAALVLFAAAGSVSAQTMPASSDAPRRGSLELSAGALFAPGYDIGSQAAELTRNGDATLGPFDLFSSETSMDAAAGFQGRLGFYLSRRVAIEGGVRYSRPTAATRLTDDSESAEDTTATEQLSQYAFDGALVYHLTNLAFGGDRAIPFVSAGASYLRELHEGDELIETGDAINATGGVKFWFGSGGSRFGLRVEAGISSRSGGFDLEDGRRTVPIFGGSLVYLF
jgi:hypothetical protein